MNKEWQFRSPKPLDLPTLAKQLEISPMLADLLVRRGFTEVLAMDRFLSPKLGYITPPNRWPQIPEAAELLVQDILQGKKIAIWGDYDVDGVTATALGLDVLEYHGVKPLYYLPDRNTEGYGLNCAALEKLAALGVKTLLTVDCGIANVEEVSRAKELGMTVIISDHHLPQAQCPKADAICNPKLMPKDRTPYAELAGVGVAFYLLAQVNILLAQKLQHRPYNMELCLDLVALGTLADLMPLTGENRILVCAGLKHIREAKRLGIAALKLISGTNIAADLKSIEISFKLAPRLNAAGRIEHAKSALELLRSKNPSQARILAEHLDALNCARRSEEEKILAEARIEALKLMEQYQASLVLFGEKWHPGIIGIVASRLVEEFGRTCIVLCKHNGVYKGSGRSFGDLNLHELLTKVADCLITFGGHKAAAALTLLPENLETFRAAFDSCAIKVSPKEPTFKLLIDGELDLTHAFSAETLEELALLEPFGQGNPEPIFVTPPVFVDRHDYLGYDHKNILLTVRDATSSLRMQAKGWRLANLFPPPSLAGQVIRLAYVLRLNQFRGIPQPELDIKDIRKAEISSTSLNTELPS